MKIIGYIRYEGTDKDTGKVFSGVSFHYLEKITSEHGKGEQSGKFSLSLDKVDELFKGNPESLLNKEVTPIYNKYGKIANLMFV